MTQDDKITAAIKCCGSVERHLKHLERSKARYATQHDRLLKLNVEAQRARYKRERHVLRPIYVAKRRALIARVKELLGGLCVCCWEPEQELLTVDHTNGDGGGYKRKSHYYTYMEIRRAFDSGGKRRISAIKRRHRLLCRNCNVSSHKGHGVCAHKREGRPTNVSRWAIRMRERLDAVKRLLGGACACCRETEIEFLTLDHVNDDGKHEPRTKLGARAHLSYYKRAERAFKSGDEAAIAKIRNEFQVLCENCNHSKHHGNGVCVHRRGDPAAHLEFPYATLVPTGTCG